MIHIVSMMQKKPESAKLTMQNHSNEVAKLYEVKKACIFPRYLSENP